MKSFPLVHEYYFESLAVCRIKALKSRQKSWHVAVFVNRFVTATCHLEVSVTSVNFLYKFL